jgi:tetratricopeptide (TPR) repeat protein
LRAEADAVSSLAPILAEGAFVSDDHRAARVTRIADVAAVPVAGGLFYPLRRALGVRAFGINAYSAQAAGDQLIEPHDELGSGSGAQEELYFIAAGHATFTVDGEEIDAPAGTLVFVPDIASQRFAVAREAGTTALVIGGPADRPLPVSPFEYWFVAEGPYLAGNFREAIAIAGEGLEQWPDHPVLHYQLACYESRDGNREAALEHLVRACAGDPRARQWAAADHDLDAIRDDPRFAAAVAGS